MYVLQCTLKDQLFYLNKNLLGWRWEEVLSEAWKTKDASCSVSSPGRVTPGEAASLF